MAKVCPHSDQCPLYAQFASQSALKIWKIRYCDSAERFPTCARYLESKKGGDVSPLLLPNGKKMTEF